MSNGKVSNIGKKRKFGQFSLISPHRILVKDKTEKKVDRFSTDLPISPVNDRAPNHSVHMEGNNSESLQKPVKSEEIDDLQNLSWNFAENMWPTAGTSQPVNWDYLNSFRHQQTAQTPQSPYYTSSTNQWPQLQLNGNGHPHSVGSTDQQQEQSPYDQHQQMDVDYNQQQQSASVASSDSCSDAISALTSLARNPTQGSTNVSSSVPQLQQPSAFRDIQHQQQPPSYAMAMAGQQFQQMNGTDFYGQTMRGRHQLDINDIYTNVIKSVPQKMAELDQQQRLAAMGRQSAAFTVVSPYQQQQQSAFRTPGGAGSILASSQPMASNAPNHLFHPNSFPVNNYNWPLSRLTGRMSTPADNLSFPLVQIPSHLNGFKVSDWQLSALMAKQSMAVSTSSTQAQTTDDSSQPPCLLQSYSIATDRENIVNVKNVLELPRDSMKPMPEYKICGVKTKEEQLITCENVEQLFSYPPLCTKSSEEESSDSYYAIPEQTFTDNGFNLAPLRDRILLYDGVYESEDSREHRLNNNIAQKTDQCKCLGSEVSEELEGPYYTHLGAGPSVSAIRKIMEERYGEAGEAIRIEKIVYTGKEGRTQDGCPLAKWIIRRSGPQEKVLCLVRERPGHRCATAVLCVLICLWDGVPRSITDDLYSYLCRVVPSGGLPTNRRCALNEQRTCACQGMNDANGGASFSFGCSWSMYYNTCKFARSRNPKRFKLMDPTEEATVERKLQRLADVVADRYKMMAPCAYRNQTYFSYRSQECRLGSYPSGPFTGVTACVDFCSHSHRDVHNMSNGCTVVVTLTNHRGEGKPDDEQYHVLPLYIPAKTDEFGSEEAQKQKTSNGSLEVLEKFPMVLRYRRDPLPNCKERNKRSCMTNAPSSSRPSPTFQPIKQECVSPATPTYYNPLAGYPGGAAGYPGTVAYPGQGFPNYAPIHQNGFYPHPYQQMAIPTWGYGYAPSTSANQQEFYWPPAAAVKVEPQYIEQSNPLKRKASFEPNGADVNGQQAMNAPDHDQPPEGFYTVNSDNDHAFADPQIGGVAVAVSHGCILFEVAKKELHATTALKNPDRRAPKRISMVFYQHKNLNFMSHGYDEWDRRIVAKKNGKVDHIAAQRAAAAKQKFEVSLPKRWAPPMAEHLRSIPANWVPTQTREMLKFSSHKANTTVVEHKDYIKKKEESTSMMTETTNSTDNN